MSQEEQLKYIRGIPFTKSPRFSKENIEAAFDYVAKDGDIVFVSYPKTGTTLLQYIVLQIISKGDFFPPLNNLMHRIVPFIEMAGISAIEDQKYIKAYKTHLPFDMIKKNDKAKYFYVYRKPEDALISYYHFEQDLRDKKILLDEYFEDYISGKVPFGQYFKHVSACMTDKNSHNLFITTYEKLVSDRRSEILRIADFLGKEYNQSVAGNETLLNSIMEHTSFDYMKSRLWYGNCDDLAVKYTRDINFFRKGEVGDGQRALSSDTLKRLRYIMEQDIEDEQVLEEWRR